MRDYCFTYETDDRTGYEILVASNIDEALDKFDDFIGSGNYKIYGIYSEPCQSK